MVLKAPAIDHKTIYQGDVELVLKNNIILSCTHKAAKSNIGKVKTVCDKCGDSVCGKRKIPICKECKENYFN